MYAIRSYYETVLFGISPQTPSVSLRITSYNVCYTKLLRALMAVFFLLIGLELERELYSGELSDFRQALLPMLAAVGGIVIPAVIHFSLNAGTP